MKHLRLYEAANVDKMWWNADVESTNPKIYVSIAWSSGMFGEDKRSKELKRIMMSELSKKYAMSSYDHHNGESGASNSVYMVLNSFDELIKFRKESDKLLDSLKKICNEYLKTAK